MIRCSECGHENMDGLEYCDACGAKLPVATADEPAPAPAAAAAEAPAETSAATPPAEASSAEAVAAPEVAAPVPVSAPAAPAPAAAPIQNVKLAIVRGGTVGKVFSLQPGDNLVGRWDPDSGAFPEVDLEADDPEARISRKHALIRLGDQVTIEDIGSLNGTFVNRSRRLDPGAPVVLKDGDEIIVGKTFFKISLA
ncbi:MAG: FHA domain-containing protein [Deltaproteobacteria bacterium]|nr:FHA domain-containing protein [Deltaproteobacteria bacterium]